MLALALCSAAALVCLYAEPLVRPLARHCCRRNRKPIAAEVLSSFGDL